MDAIAQGKLAVITGGASGIGLSAARRFARLGMQVVIADWSDEVAQIAAGIDGNVSGFRLDVADAGAVTTFANEIVGRFGAPSLLMNNAGVGQGGDVLSNPQGWTRVLGVNLFGVLHGCQAFVPAMIASGAPGVVVNTGSKQGITQPPGDTAYNVSKSGVKALTEGLAHTLRKETGGRVAAHLLIPGFTYTGMTGGGGATGKPAAAWTADQVIDFLLESVARGDFYILCPDNDVSRETDEKRIAWGAGDIIENRPALSRWHPDWEARFAAYMRDE